MQYVYRLQMFLVDCLSKHYSIINFNVLLNVYSFFMFMHVYIVFTISIIVIDKCFIFRTLLLYTYYFCIALFITRVIHNTLVEHNDIF